MFCNNCGTKLEDGAQFCDNCGAATGATSTVEQKKEINSGKGLLYSTVIIALISAILPFLNWVEVPAINAVSSWLGGSNSAASYSLFGYIFAGASDSLLATIIILVLAVVAVVSVIFNAMYCVKAFKGKPNSGKYGKTGSILLLIMSILFWIIVGMISLIIKVIKLTPTVYFAIGLSIANIVLIKKLKKN